MEARQQLDITDALLRVQAADETSDQDTKRLFEVVYEELRRLAAGIMRGERADHTLQPTALVHEAYCRLVDRSRVNWENRAHFLGIAARAMRQILVDHARRRASLKRGGEWQRITADERLSITVPSDAELLDLDMALCKLDELDERMARIVELRVFGGLTAEETSRVLGMSRSTVQRDWQMARLWLARELSESSKP
jgi:RNA polymerase sigma factor (TIGR02999 family)